MTTRFVKGKGRTETPRIKDLPVSLVRQATETGRKPSDGRRSDGRFDTGNRLAVGAGEKALIKRGLGDPDDPATAELARDALKLYGATLRSLPSDGPVTRQLSAAYSRNATLACHLANLAAKAGLGTPEGLKLAEAARSHDTTAQKLAVTAYDRAVREAGKPNEDPYQALERRMAAVAARIGREMNLITQLLIVAKILFEAGFHNVSAWWIATLTRFWQSGQRTLVLRVGRRGGKSSTLCVVAVLEALFGGRRVSRPVISAWSRSSAS